MFVLVLIAAVLAAPSSPARAILLGADGRGRGQDSHNQDEHKHLCLSHW